MTPTPAAMPTVPGAARPCIPGTDIALGDGERVWKQYAVTHLPAREILGLRISRATGRGTLFVTNARVLFFATFERRGGKRSLVLQETQVEHVTGVSAYVSRSFSLFAAVIVCVIGLAGLSSVLEGSTGGGLLLLIIAGFGAFLLSQGLGQRGAVGVSIHSGSSQSSPLGFGGETRGGGFFKSLFVSILGPYGQLLTAASGPQDARDLLLALPGPQAEQVVVELGALIADLQSKGDLAGTHWGVID
ncbi:MAG TPA: hypothetical protein VK680_05610 [Solirubrobacteraceae bacterium]|nr:hypothetical protein [Solirubrobacteraceae bacterium]